MENRTCQNYKKDFVIEPDDFGFYTQIAALILALITFAETYIEYKEPVILKRNFVFYILLLAISLSPLFSGAGAFAIDLPL